MTYEPPILPITPAEEAWLVAKCEHIDRLAADTEPEVQEPAPRHWPVVFMDLDDVVATNELFGGLDALDALRGKRIDADLVFERLWSPMAREILVDLSGRHRGRLRWVISSTWRLHFTRAQLQEVMRRSGLGCVADGMEPKERWRTPHFPGQTRCHEVLAWLREHHRGEPWVILDDVYSWGPSAHVAPGVEVPRTRLVLCEEWVGLQLRHVPRIVAALATR
ncbi:HAD domain-containing protein [Roseateles sp. BYS78W]|uniref:HAD domain-containing protein n=1 Tax=Pelomonas candidula TaxID=3299025 RepID=A0ABW7HEP7_9BURK